MAWEMLTGRLPFLADNPVTMVFKHVNENVPSVAWSAPGCDPQVARFISYLTNRDVNDRPADASQALDRLNALMRTLSPQALQYRFDPDAPAPNATTVLPVSGKAQTGPTAAKLDDRTQAVPMAGAATATSAPHTTAVGTAHCRQRRCHADPSAPWHVHGQALGDRRHHRRRGVGSGRRRGMGMVVLRRSGQLLRDAADRGIALPGERAVQDRRCTVGRLRGGAEGRRHCVRDIQIVQRHRAGGRHRSTDPEFVNAHVSKRGDLQKVRVIVSQGVQQATVPDDIMSSTDPLASLKRAGFTNIVHSADTDEWSLGAPEGEVISIAPEAGTTVDHLEPVDVVLSKGPMPVSMPEVVGKPASDVKGGMKRTSSP